MDVYPGLHVCQLGPKSYVSKHTEKANDDKRSHLRTYCATYH
jgi:hypothetical protein